LHFELITDVIKVFGLITIVIVVIVLVPVHTLFYYANLGLPQPTANRYRMVKR
jgi:hypothetical protein